MPQQKSRIETDKNIINFLNGQLIETTEDLVALKNLIINSLEFRPYNEETKKYADSIQWKRTASEIISDGYVYQEKACSDLAIVFLALCKAAGVEGRLVKLITVDGNDTHSIVEINLNGNWYRMDTSYLDSITHEGKLGDKKIWNKKYKLWKRGRDVWDLGLDDIKHEDMIV